MSITTWISRFAAIGATPNETAAIQASYYGDSTAVQQALDTLIDGMDTSSLIVMLNTWRTAGAPFHAGYPGGGLPFGAGAAILTGNPSDDVYAISAGTGGKLSGFSGAVDSVMATDDTIIVDNDDPANPTVGVTPGVFVGVSGSLTDGNLLEADSGGNAEDSGVAASSVVTDANTDGAITVDSTGIADTQVLAYSESEGKLLPVDQTGGGGSVEVTDGTTSVSDVTEIDFTSGATVTDGGDGIAEVAISGGDSSVTVQGAIGTNLGATATVDFASTQQPIWLVGTLNDDLAVTQENWVEGCLLLLGVLQDGDGGHAVTVDGADVAVNQDADSPSGVLVANPDSSNSLAFPLSLSGPQGEQGNPGTAGSTAAGTLQNGVLLSTDVAISSISIDTSTGALTFTLAAGSLYVLSSGGVLTAVSYAGGTYTKSIGSITSGDYAVIGVEIDTSGDVAINTGPSTSTQLNTGSLIASHTPATSTGTCRVWDFSVWNDAGSYEFGDKTTTPTQGTNYIDRRPWARGAFIQIDETGGDYLTTSTSFVALDSTHLAVRLECTGVPLRIRLLGSYIVTSGNHVQYTVYEDGSQIDGVSFVTQLIPSTTAVTNTAPLIDYVTMPSAGSHLFIPYWLAGGSGNVTTHATSSFPLHLIVEEDVRQNASNGTA